MRLYHFAQAEIKKPDIRHGRMNADFGQGFYLTENRSFAEKWAAVVNIYELETTGLLIKRFSRDSAWFDYIFGNRHSHHAVIRISGTADEQRKILLLGAFVKLIG